MNYQKIYASLITKAKNRNTDVGFYELHHIIPRCMNGTDLPTNLIKLTIREHYFAHLLLCKIYPDEIGLYRAVFLMSNTRQLKNSKDVERLKLQWRRLLKSKQMRNCILSKMKTNNIDHINEFAEWWVNVEWMEYLPIKKQINSRPRAMSYNIVDESIFKTLIKQKGAYDNINKDEIARMFDISKNKAKKIRKLIAASKKTMIDSIINEYIEMGTKYYEAVN